MSGECEAVFDLGLRVNLDAGRVLLEALRRGGRHPMLVFASSLAVYGGWPGQQLPPVVTDATLAMPLSSYGIQKFIMEQLVADYTPRDPWPAGRCRSRRWWCSRADPTPPRRAF